MSDKTKESTNKMSFTGINRGPDFRPWTLWPILLGLQKVGHVFLGLQNMEDYESTRVEMSYLDTFFMFRLWKSSFKKKETYVCVYVCVWYVMCFVYIRWCSYDVFISYVNMIYNVFNTNISYVCHVFVFMCV